MPTFSPHDIIMVNRPLHFQNEIGCLLGLCHDVSKVVTLVPQWTEWPTHPIGNSLKKQKPCTKAPPYKIP